MIPVALTQKPCTNTSSPPLVVSFSPDPLGEAVHFFSSGAYTMVHFPKKETLRSVVLVATRALVQLLAPDQP